MKLFPSPDPEAGWQPPAWPPVAAPSGDICGDRDRMFTSWPDLKEKIFVGNFNGHFCHFCTQHCHKIALPITSGHGLPKVMLCMFGQRLPSTMNLYFWGCDIYAWWKKRHFSHFWTKLQKIPYNSANEKAQCCQDTSSHHHNNWRLSEAAAPPP